MRRIFFRVIIETSSSSFNSIMVSSLIYDNFFRAYEQIGKDNKGSYEYKERLGK